MDRWQHRSKEMRCASCMWFCEKEIIKAPEEPVPEKNYFGRCRRHAPTMSGYPAVFGGDWCGDHKLNEESL